MPELPEVETMVRGLRPVLSGQVLARARLLDPRMVCGEESLERLQARLTGARITGVDRRGKWVVMAHEAPAGYLVIQPRMTGGFWLVPPPREDHVRAIWTLRASQRSVWFCDTRRLGRIQWYADEKSFEAALARSHGPDALGIDVETLGEALRRTDRPVKAVLMDQKVVAGIGNIYADEILHRAGVHPAARAMRLSRSRRQAIHAAIRPVLETAIAAEGSSFDAGYRTVLGLEGGFLAQNAVHRHCAEPCPRCGAAIIKTRIPGLIGRPTYFCPGCQKKA
jgi:formamidopyrimidine-DNA glycosylase